MGRTRAQILNRLTIAACLSFLFMTIEAIGGYTAGSLAIFSDAAHLFADFAAFAVAIAAHRLTDQPPTEKYTYGLQRVESLSAFVSMLLLALVCLVIAGEACHRLFVLVFTPDDAADIDAQLMTVIAAIGVCVNITLAILLGSDHVHLPGTGDAHNHCHDHTHGHDHHHESSTHHNDDQRSHDTSHDHFYDEENKHNEEGHSHAHEHCHEEGHSHDDHGHGHDNPHAAEHMEHIDHNHNHTSEKEALVSSDAAHENKYMTYSYQQSPNVEFPVIPEALLPEALLPEALLSKTKESNPSTHSSDAPVVSNINIHAAYIHVLGDLAQSIAVLVAGAIIWAEPSWKILDPLLSLVFSVLVFYSTLDVIKASFITLMEGVPNQLNWKHLRDDLDKLECIRDVHDLHVWSIGDGNPCASLHATASDPAKVDEAMLHVKNVLWDRHQIRHVTMQIQASGEECIVCKGDTHASCL